MGLDTRMQFKDYLQSLAEIRHPNLIKYYKIKVQSQKCMIEMPFVKEPLIDLIKNTELSEFQIQFIVTKVFEGLLELHSR